VLFAVEARRIYIALRSDKLDEARENLSRIVGRDTENLSEEEVIRATVESVAESFVDGILSPLFYAAIGGAPLAMAYKAINTLDSMVGNRSARYREFGYWPAKFDTIVNWFPARLSWFLIGIGAFFVTGRVNEAWRVGLQETSRSEGNSAVPEAAFAGGLGVEIGGTNYYGGKPVKTPKLGYSERPLGRQDIRTASSLMFASSWAALAFSLILYFGVKLLFHHY
jgi:adenosylcobinamide-phosphate synthase